MHFHCDLNSISDSVAGMFWMGATSDASHAPPCQAPILSGSDCSRIGVPKLLHPVLSAPNLSVHLSASCKYNPDRGFEPRLSLVAPVGAKSSARQTR